MHEELFSIGSFPVRSYGVMILAGYLTAVFLACRRGRLMGFESSLISDLGIVALLSGILGARIFYLAQYHHRFSWVFFDLRVSGISMIGGLLGAASGLFLFTFFFSTWLPFASGVRKHHLATPVAWCTAGMLLGLRVGYFLTTPNIPSWKGDPLEIFRIDHGGLVLWGGLLLGIPSCAVFLWRRKVSILEFADLIAPSLAIGLAFGRLGCFLNGCCFGKMVDGFPGVSFPAHSPPWMHQVQTGVIAATAPSSIPVVPAQILSSCGAFCLFWILTAALKRPWRDGRVGVLFLVLYTPWRFVLETLRNDTVPVLGNLTIAQTVSIPVFILVFPLFIALGGRNQ